MAARLRAQGVVCARLLAGSATTRARAACAPAAPQLARWYTLGSGRTDQPDLAEDAYEHPDSAPRRRTTPSDVVSSIVAGVESDRAAVDTKRTLAILVDNEAGVLNKITGLLSARGFNIESLTVSPTNIPDLSRMTIAIRDAPAEKAGQALKQLNDVVNVWAVIDYTGTNSLQRELLMVKVSYMPNSGDFRTDARPDGGQPTYREQLAAQAHRASVRDIGQLFGAEVVDVGSRHITFQLTSWSRRIDAFVRMLEPWGVIEVARSGVVAMLRSAVSGTHADQIRAPTAAVPDASQLPPG